MSTVVNQDYVIVSCVTKEKDYLSYAKEYINNLQDLNIYNCQLPPPKGGGLS